MDARSCLRRLMAASLTGVIILTTATAMALTGSGSDSDRRQACQKAKDAAAAQAPGRKLKYGECQCAKNPGNRMFECTITVE